MAAAAGVKAGAILSIGEGSSAVAALQVVQQSVSIPGGIAYPLNTGITTIGVGYASVLTSPVYPTSQPTCSLTVQFQLM